MLLHGEYDEIKTKVIFYSDDDLEETFKYPIGHTFEINEELLKHTENCYFNEEWGYFHNVLFVILKHIGYEGKIKVCRIEGIQ